MKEFLFKIKNNIKNFAPFKKINPHIYWNNLLYIFSIILALLVLFSFYLLYKIKNQQIFQITPISVESQVFINEKILDKVTKSFDIKAIKEKEAKEGLYLYKDPSI
ncbi:MAG: hypothetical protein WCT42_02625 [Candidatus Paceibacterota bacterium]